MSSKKKANELKPNNTIHHENKIWKIISTTHIKPGKGPAYIQASVKNLNSDTSKTLRFRSDESINMADRVNKDFIYSYDIGDDCFFSDIKTYEEVSIKKDLIKNFNFLVDDMKVTISFIDDKPYEVIMPNSIVCKVKVTDPVVKGQNAGTGRKSATLTNGVVIQVPLHMSDDTEIIINPNTLEYIAKK